METVDQLLQGKLSLLLQCNLWTSSSLCLWHEPYFVIFILSREDDDDVRDSRKHDLRSVLQHLMLSIVNLASHGLTRTCKAHYANP